MNSRKADQDAPARRSVGDGDVRVQEVGAIRHVVPVDRVDLEEHRATAEADSSFTALQEVAGTYRASRAAGAA